MTYQIVIPKKSQKELEKIDNRHKIRVLAALSDLAKNPFAGKKLEGEHKGQWSLRVWPYRVIYEIYENKLIILIIGIGHRKDIYK